jgi:hypothetical protein
METSGTSPTPDEAATALRQADSAGSALAGGLLLPSHFYSSIGTATAVQIGTAAAALANHNGWGIGVAIAGVLVQFCVGGIQIARFRSLNGVRVRGFESRVVGGTAITTSTFYGLAFGGALWAASMDAWWLVPMFAVLGGLGYAVGGQRWWRTYQRDPAGNSRGDSAVWLIVLYCALVASMVALVIGS